MHCEILHIRVAARGNQGLYHARLIICLQIFCLFLFTNLTFLFYEQYENYHRAI